MPTATTKTILAPVTMDLPGRLVRVSLTVHRIPTALEILVMVNVNARQAISGQQVQKLVLSTAQMSSTHNPRSIHQQRNAPVERDSQEI